MSLVRTITALTLLLALLAIHIFVVVAVGYSISHHSDLADHGSSGAHHMSDCPLMSHGETLCPMTALDHLAAFRSLFETTLPAIITLGLIIGVGVFWWMVTHPLRPLLLLPAHTFLRQRKRVLYEFYYRQYQELLASGIWHQKIYN